jgi:hypothetical protein
MMKAVAKARASDGIYRPLMRCAVMITSRVLITNVNRDDEVIAGNNIQAM